MKFFKLLMFCLTFVFLFGSVYAYGESNFNPFPSIGAFSSVGQGSFDQSICEGGQDFVIQIAPGGCTPAVVRSDLLEEEDVPVFCALQAIKVNPLITVKAIESIHFAKKDYPQDVQSIGFFPSYSALSSHQILNDMRMNNIGYAVITLRRNANESSMPEWVEGSLVAEIRYDIEDAFGLHNRVFYLPVMNNRDYDKEQGKYSFFNNMGYLRAEDVDVDSASIGIYSGTYESLFGGSDEGDYARQKVARYNLKKGESKEFYLPGFDCLSSANLKLEDVEYQDTRAKFSVNSESIEVKEDETFLEGKCKVLDEPTKKGLRQTVRVRCRGDDGFVTKDLSINPIVRLGINGEEKEYKVGDFLVQAGDKRIYLGYIGTQGKFTGEEDLEIYLVAVPGNQHSLTNDQIALAAKLYEYYSLEDSNLRKGFLTAYAMILNVYGWGVNGENHFALGFEDSKNFNDVAFEFLGFGGGSNLPLNNATLSDYYENAKESFEVVYENFFNEKYPENAVNNLGEKSLYNLVWLSNALYQIQDLKKYCGIYSESYSDSKLDFSLCKRDWGYSNKGVSYFDILIDGKVKEISFEGVSKPSFEEYGVNLVVRDSEGNVLDYDLRKGDEITLNKTTGESIKFVEILSEDEAIFDVKVDKGVVKKIGNFLSSSREKLMEDKSETFGSSITFTLRKIHQEKVAKVSISSSPIYPSTEANFSFKIGIEKRAIKLSPAKTRERIIWLNETINKWESISESLGKVVNTMKDACFYLGLGLNLKNLIGDSSGEAISRKEVMSGAGGWNERCADKEDNGVKYGSVESCLFANSDKIDAEVKLVGTKINDINERMKEIQKYEGVIQKNSFLEEDYVNSTAVATYFSRDVINSLDGLVPVNPNKPSDKINMVVVQNALNANGFDNRFYSLNDLKDIQLYSELLKSNPENEEAYQGRLFAVLKQVEKNSEDFLRIDAAKIESNKIGFSSIDFSVYLNKDQKSWIYKGYVAPKDFPEGGNGIKQGDLIQGVSYDGIEYYVKLGKLGDGTYDIKGVYSLTGKKVDSVTSNKIERAFPVFEKVDSESYHNPIKDAKVRYYGSELYANLPAVVPFDLVNGWYAYVEQTLPSFGEMRSYDDSGRVNSFWICNVGQNGLIEYSPFGDDEICEMINVGTGQSYNKFPGLTNSEASKVIDRAVKAIEQASRQYRDGIQNVVIEGNKIPVGSPSTGSVSVECMDLMSPGECKLLFNVCDPVICPASRCDFGGLYPVKDVVQSGIIGGITLCLPNWNEDIYMPVCLTGIKAGIDGVLSVGKSYRDCLQMSLETGQTIGICDEINSIYMCELFWRQALPLTQLVGKKVLGLVSGEGTRGGGEYMKVESALENAKNSVNYFTQFYAENAFAAFRARSQAEVGTEICKASISLAFPNSMESLDLFSKSDSPPQFHGKFDTIPFTTATNPPVNQYKVFYHIFAGNDKGVNYRVYLRGGGGSYFQDTSASRFVASGFIPAGEYATASEDFTAPEGYKELCIQVDNYEECGFGVVSTEFALDYVKDQYIKGQVTERGIKSDKECISGTADPYSLLNLNAQEGVDNLINPEIYNKGIIRICATDNPGMTSDPYYGLEDQRWIEVGHCDDLNIKCYMDTQSIDDAVEFQITADESLKELSDGLLEDLVNSGQYIGNAEFSIKVQKIREMIIDSSRTEKTLFEALDLISPLFEDVFTNNQKGYLYYLKGDVYSKLARGLFNLLGLDELIDDEFAEEDEFLGAVDEWDMNAIKDNSSHSGFISNRFEYASGNFGANMCFQFYKGLWIWKVGCGEISVPFNQIDGWSSVKESRNNAELTEIQKYFFSGLDGKNYSDGLNVLINRVNQDKDGFWFMSPSLVSGDVEYNSDKVFYISGTYFKFESGSWKYSLNEDDWFLVFAKRREESVSQNDGKLNLNQKDWENEIGLKFTTAIAESTRDSQEFYPEQVVGERYDIVSSLVDKTFIEGVKILFTLGSGQINLEGDEILDKFLVASNSSSVEILGEPDLSKPSSSSCPIPEKPDPEIVGKVSNPQERVLEACNKYVNTVVYRGENGCYSAVEKIYERAGVITNVPCAYSDYEGKEYFGDGGNKILTGSPTFAVNSNSCYKKGLSENEKLNLLKPGYLISYYFGLNSKKKDSGHNAIFISWENKDKRIAKLYDWNGRDGSNKVYRYYTSDLSDDKHFVYMFWEPVSLDETLTSYVGKSCIGIPGECLDSSKDVCTKGFITEHCPGPANIVCCPE